MIKLHLKYENMGKSDVEMGILLLEFKLCSKY